MNGTEKERKPVAPYLAIGVSTVVHGIGSRADIAQNLDIVEDAIHAAMGIISINMPVKLIALAEGALTGFTDEAFDVPHVTAGARAVHRHPRRGIGPVGRLWRGCTRPTWWSSARRAGPRSCPTGTSTRCS